MFKMRNGKVEWVQAVIGPRAPSTGWPAHQEGSRLTGETPGAAREFKPQSAPQVSPAQAGAGWISHLGVDAVLCARSFHSLRFRSVGSIAIIFREAQNPQFIL